MGIYSIIINPDQLSPGPDPVPDPDDDSTPDEESQGFFDKKLNMILTVSGGSILIILIIVLIVWLCCCRKPKADPLAVLPPARVDNQEREKLIQPGVNSAARATDSAYAAVYPDKEESDREEKMTKRDAQEMQERFDNHMRIKQEEIEKLKD